ncbi:MAG: diguanylate cyclase, partial [Rubrivivax sp.]|nr:diguanylate cyclase [Rubrivivax sp.]
MTRRIQLLIAGVLLLALAGSLAVHTRAARQVLQSQLELRNREAASALASSLSQQHGDPVLLQTLTAAQFDLGHYRSLRLIGREGQALPALRQDTLAGRAPAWFELALPMVAATGSAPVRDGGREIGRLEVELHAAWAHDALWDDARRTGLLLALLLLAAGGFAGWLLRLWRRSLQATVAQAQALEQGRLVEAQEPPLPELRQLTRSMNATVRRLREGVRAQAEQVALLQRQAHLDAVTGLPLRRQFVGQLQDQLNEPCATGSALVLVRVSELEMLNARLGHEATDRVLCAVADVLQTYVERVVGTLAGRLNGSDFGLSLPVSGVAAETAASIHATLAAT